MPQRPAARSRGLGRDRGGVRTRSRPPPSGGGVLASADHVGWATRPSRNLALCTRAWRRVAHAVEPVGLTAWAKSPTIIAITTAEAGDFAHPTNPPAPARTRPRTRALAPCPPPPCSP